MWTPLATQFEGFQVITFDAPGTGLSKAPVLPYPLSFIVDVAIGVLDELGHQQVDVLGYSLGGAVAQQLALQAPLRVRRLVLASTSCGAGAIPGDFRALMAVMTPARYYAKSGYRVASKIINLAPAERDSQFLKDQIDNWHREAAPSMRGYALQINAFSLFNRGPWLHRVKQPTLVICRELTTAWSLWRILRCLRPICRMRASRSSTDGVTTSCTILREEPVRPSATSSRPDDHKVTSAWMDARTVSQEDMREVIRSAPRSAHPYQYTNALIRRLYPLQRSASQRGV